MQKINLVTELRWANSDKDIVNFNVKFDELTESINYFLGKADRTVFAQNLWQEVVSGKWGSIAEWDPTVCDLSSIVIPPISNAVTTFVDGQPQTTGADTV